MKEIELPDGTIAEFPADMSDDSIKQVLRQKFPPTRQQQAPQQSSYDNQGSGYAAARNFLNEATFGFGKNAVAGLRSLASGDYEKELAYQKKQLAGDVEQYPVTSTLAGIGGAVGTSLAATPARVANWVGKGGSFLNRSGRLAVVGAPSGALYGVGNRQEGESIPEAAARGGTAGALFAPVGVAAGDLVSGGIRAIRSGVQGLNNLRSGTTQLSPEQQLIKEAENIGVPIRTSDLMPPTTRAGKSAELAARMVPFAGTGKQVAKQQEKRLAAVSDELVKYNPDLGQDPRTLELLSNEVTSSVEKSAKKQIDEKTNILYNNLYNTDETIANKIENYYNNISSYQDDINNLKINLSQETNPILRQQIKNEIADKTSKLNEFNNSSQELQKNVTSIPIPNTLKKIDELIARWTPNAKAKSGSEEAKAMIEKLQEFKTRFSSNLGTKFLENERALLSTQYADNPTVKDLANKLYDPLNKDMGLFIKSKNLADYEKWQFANKKISKTIKEKELTALGKIILKNNVTPETIKTSIFSKKYSDLRRLNENLSPDGRKKVQSVIIGDIAEKTSFTNPNGTKGFSPEKFISELNRKKDQIDVFFDTKDKASLEGLSRVMNATRGAGQAALNPLTGMQLAGVTSLNVLGSATGTLAGSTALAAGIGLTGRAYESKMFRDFLVMLSKTKKNSSEEKLLINKIISMQTGQLAAKENIKEN
jgi:hypothetical protein